MSKRPGYLADMLRPWAGRSAGSPAWRVSLESPHTGARPICTSLAELVAVLGEEVEEIAERCDLPEFLEKEKDNEDALLCQGSSGPAAGGSNDSASGCPSRGPL